MSHYSVVSTKITRVSALKKALCKLGFQSHMIEESEELMTLKGYGGDFRTQKANLRIKGRGWGSTYNYVGGASNDLGWQKQPDGTYSFHVSDYDKGRYNEKWQKKLLQHYGAEVVKEVAEESGFFLESEEEIEGELFLQISSPF